MPQPLTELEFQAEYAARPGLIPVELDTVGRTIVWLDLNGFHCQEGFFRDSLATYSALRRGNPWRCASDLDLLLSPALTAGCVSPTAFIFHAGRCGSTLLSRAIARSTNHLVFSEAAPHNQIWRNTSGANDSCLSMYRNLLLLMARPRLPSYRAHIVKFTSFNIVQFDFIRAAFPGVPALFLFRSPEQILSSYRRETPQWMGKDLGVGKVWHTPETAVGDFFRQALSIRDPDFRYLDYKDLTPESLPGILRFFHLDPSASELTAMLAEFQWDAKSGNRQQPFSRNLRESPAAPHELRRLYEELSRRQ
jgi:hypothetical protein